MISRLLCLLPSAALFTLTIWPFGLPPPRSPLRWRPRKKLCFDWSAGLSTGVFLSIRANVRPPFFQWIPTKLTSNPTSSYSAPTSVSIQLQLFLGSPSTVFSLAPSHLRFNRMVSVLKRHQYHQIGMPTPSGYSRHHRPPLVFPYPTSTLRGFSTAPTSHPGSFYSVCL